MRYLDWDVLLFQANNKAPMQEFSTHCFVVIDHESTFHKASLNPSSYVVDEIVSERTPMVTTHIASLKAGTPFKVSLHSWSTPGPSKALSSLLETEGDTLFELRLLLDGIPVNNSIFKGGSNWPQTIDTATEANQGGLLCFPTHHPGVAQRINSSEDIGTIKVIVSEGAFSKATGSFQRARTVVIFNFLHAPLDTLERQNLAYPNPLMWFQPRQPAFGGQTTAPRHADRSSDERTDHGHSPSRQSQSNTLPSGPHGLQGPFDSRPTILPPGTSALQAQHLSFGQSLQQGLHSLAPDWNSRDPAYAYSSIMPNDWRYPPRYHSSSDESMPDAWSLSPPSGVESVPFSNDGSGHFFAFSPIDAGSQFARVNTPPPWLTMQPTLISGIIPPANSRITSQEGTPLAGIRATHPHFTDTARRTAFPPGAFHHSSTAFDYAGAHSREKSDVTMQDESSNPSAAQTNPKSPIPAQDIKGKKEGDMGLHTRNITTLADPLGGPAESEVTPKGEERGEVSEGRRGDAMLEKSLNLPSRSALETAKEVLLPEEPEVKGDVLPA
ncbi:MAG: hypothetical protein M1814_005035 [Vezdaea aestivalis]|nr:MAG: hypothetical protein M1814_005035 [Vezdaea aestivalis]